MAYIRVFPRFGGIPPRHAAHLPFPQFGGVLRAPAGERNVLLIHGTTLPRARAIVSQQGLSAHKEAYFVLGRKNRDLARIFADRASRRSPGEGPPALVLVTIPESTFDWLRKNGLLGLRPFDRSDPPELRNRNQWVLKPGGVEILNRQAESWRLIPLRPRGTA